jgi:predicted dehydrogenase
MLANVPDLDAICICTPPQVHYQAAKHALRAGKHVLLEKPPCTSVAQCSHLKELAEGANVSLYQTWHSQHAHSVNPAALFLKSRKLLKVRVIWKEDVRRWHPGQTWIWEAGGFGVLDPGINAISILTRLIDEPLFPESATLFVPANCETPIAANICLRTSGGVEIDMELDFRHGGKQIWDIEIDTDSEPIRLSGGGSTLTIGDRRVPAEAGAMHGEYQHIYRRFAELISSRRCEADMRPLTLVADIFLAGKRIVVEPFVE